MFPWGVPTAQVISSQTIKKTESFQAPNLIELPANSLTTDKFDQQMVDKISTLTTDKTFSWIITKPTSYYNVGQYFIREIFTQLVVAFLLTLLLFFTTKHNFKTRLIITLLVGTMAVTAIFGQMLNWWGIPAIYALGAGFNLIIGWFLISFVSSKWIIKSE
ncbi:MAG: hypothetical protein MUE53_01165 [Chitinophagales bacterium]|jgi:hypothetical protein|nr:hypothetical protein [Chitinophagales bacterium]